MKTSSAKSQKQYDQAFEMDLDRILAAKQGIPYQVLIRVFILDALNRMKKAA
ncbi:MAG: hypothetical protein KGQ59_02725 [Bdellovibrionales bacterium]|nr:hypothetical protein [Bdellovibrionales bacterium]